MRNLMAIKADFIPFENIFARPLRNGLTRPKAVRGKGVKMINMGELFAHSRINNVETDRVPFTDNENSFLLDSGDLLFARQSLVLAGAGKCSIFVGDNEEVTYEGHIIRARINSKIADPFFYYYFFNSQVGRQTIESIVEQVAAAGIRGSDLAKLKVPFPPLPEQRAIAGILGALDDKIEVNRRMNATLESIARAVFRQWFVENEEVNDWEVVPLPEIIEVNPSRSLKKGEIAPYLDMANMPMQGHRGIEWIDRAFGSGTKFTNGDTLLARITPCLENGKTAFVDFLRDGQVGWGSTEYIVFHPKPPLPPEYGYYLARSEELRSHAIQNMTGTSGRQRTPASCFNSFMISKPPDELARKFGEFANSVIQKVRANDQQSRTLASLRDCLLPKLMKGEVRVKEINTLDT